jgi:hypothetical protein
MLINHGRIPWRLCDAQQFWGLLCVDVMKAKQNVVELTFHAVGFRFVEPYILLCLTPVLIQAETECNCNIWEWPMLTMMATA